MFAWCWLSRLKLPSFGIRCVPILCCSGRAAILGLEHVRATNRVDVVMTVSPSTVGQAVDWILRPGRSTLLPFRWTVGLDRPRLVRGLSAVLQALWAQA